MAFRFSFFPRDEQFFELFNQMADEIRAAAGLLEEMLATEPPDAHKVDLIKDAEHRCDALTHDTIQRLHRTFVTPFDREDLYALATSLDNVMDAIDHAAALVRLYQHHDGPAGRARAGAHRLALGRSAAQPRSTRWRRRSRCSRTRSRSTGSRTKPTARIRRPCSALFDTRDRSDRDHQVEGALRRARADHGCLRGRRQRHRRRRREARIARRDARLQHASSLIIVVALVFDYINGFHDAANSIATVVSTRVLSPLQAVAWAAFFNFVAGVRLRHGRGEDGRLRHGRPVGRHLRGDPGRPASARSSWNLITWYFGLPTSSSHALFGGYARRGRREGRVSAPSSCPAGPRRSSSSSLAPLIGLTVGLIVMTSIFWMFRDSTPTRVDRWFRRLQLLSAAAYSLMHGANDAQKTMGIITGALVTGGYPRRSSKCRSGSSCCRTPRSASAR